jgi:hypothetical protein
MVVACGRDRHRLRWRAGQVETVDHPELDAELALVALGGEEPTCVARYRLWNEALADGGFVAEWIDETRLSPAWFSWLAMALERMRTEGFHEFLRALPPARAQRMGEFLDHFPLPWIDRAAAEVNRRLTEGPGVVTAEAGPLLAQAAAQRLRRSFVDAVGGRQLAVGAAALVPLRPAVVAGAAPAVAGTLTGPERGVDLSVDRTWLHRVWAAGASVIDRRLVLALDPGPGGPLATMVDWPDGGSGPPVLITRPVRHTGAAWEPDPEGEGGALRIA